MAHQIAVDDVVLVQRRERAEALPSDLLHALHLSTERRSGAERVGLRGEGGRLRRGSAHRCMHSGAYREVLWQPALVDVLVAGTAGA